MSMRCPSASSPPPTPYPTTPLASSSLDKISVWDLKKGVLSKTLAPCLNPSRNLAVNSIAVRSSRLASGHADGSVRVWDLAKGICEATINGHKSAVTALRFDAKGEVLASGSKDCDVIVWDVVGEAGLYRFRGHRDQITNLAFLDSGKKLVSCSKDKFVRVGDLEMQHCMQIVSGHQSEIWSLDIDREERFLVTGSADRELRFYQIKHANEENDSSTKWEVLKHFGEISRQCEDRVANVRLNEHGNLLVCQAAGKTVEIYQVLNDAEANRKAKRRVHRKKGKASAKAAAEGKENVIVVDPIDSQHRTIIVSDVF